MLYAFAVVFLILAISILSLEFPDIQRFVFKAAAYVVIFQLAYTMEQRNTINTPWWYRAIAGIATGIAILIVVSC